MARALRRVAIWLAVSLALFLALLVVAGVLFTQVPALRVKLARWGEQILLAYGEVKLEAKEIVRLDPWGAELRGAHVEAPEIGLSADVERVRVSFRPWALLKRDVRFASGQLWGVRIRFGRAVVRALTPEEQAEEAAEEAEGGAGWGATVERVALSDVELVTYQLSESTLRIAHVRGAFSYRGAPDFWVERARLSATHGDVELLTAATLAGAYRAASGGTAQLAGLLAGAPVRVSARFPGWEESWEPLPLDVLHVRLEEVDRKVLRRLGLDARVPLRSPVNVKLSTWREGARLPFVLGVVGDGAAVRARGSYRTGALEAELDVHAKELSRIVEGLPARSLRGSLRAEYRFGGREQRGSARWTRIAVGRDVIPAGSLALRTLGRALVLDRLELREGHALVYGSGRYHLDSKEAEAQLHVRALELQGLGAWLGEPLGGALTGNLSLRRARDAEITLTTQLVIGAPRYGARLSARRIVSDATFSGTLAAPRVAGTFKAQDLRIDQRVVPRVSTKFTLENQNFNADLGVIGEGSELHALVSGLLDVESRGATVRAELRGHLAGRALSGRLAELTVGGGAVRVRALTLRSGAARLAADGSWRAEGTLDLRLRARDLPLPWLGALAGMPELRGRLTTSAQISGDVARPRLGLELSLREASLGEAPALDTTLSLSLDGVARRARGSLVSFGAAGRLLNASFELDWPDRSKPVWEALPRAHGRVYATLRGRVDELPLPPGWDLAALSGSFLELGANLEGTLEDPRGLITLALKEREDGPPQIDARALVDDQQAAIDLAVSDNRRADPLLELHGAVALAGLSAPHAVSSLADGDRDLEATAYWQVDALDQLRGSLGRLVQGLQVALPLRTTGQLVVTREQGRLAGSLQAIADVRSARLDPACDPRLRASMIMRAILDDQRFQGSVTAQTSRGGNAFANWTLPARWLWDFQQRAGDEAATLDVEAENVPLRALPGLCGLDNGYARLSSRTTLVPGVPLTSGVYIRVEGLSAARAQPLTLELNGKIDPKELFLFANFGLGGQSSGTLEATLPLRYDGYRPGIVLSAPAKLKLKARDLELAPLLQFSDAVGRPSGALSADLTVTGSIRKPKARGYVEMNDLSFTLASLAQPVRNLNGRLEFTGDALILHEVSARDRGGKLSVAGEARMDPSGSANAKLKLQAENLPVRRQGQIVGQATFGADVTAELDAQTKLTVDAAVRYATLHFAGTTGKSVQGLDRHPDVRFADEKDERPLELATSPSGFALRAFEVKSLKNLLIKHQDFSVEVGLNLTIEEVKGEEKLLGEATIVRGDLKLLGKSFTIQRGSVRFTEESDEPELNLRASFEPPGGGTPLNVQIAGRASDPGLTFSGAADTPEQAFAILSGMSAAQAAASAQADVNAFGLSLTAGLLSMTARQRFGAWVPTVSVGSNVRGEASQARAGFDASKMIPPFMRGFARGAYVEGIVGNTQQGGPGGSVGLGVRFEIALPRSTVTRFGYGPGTNWSIDVAWVP